MLQDSALNRLGLARRERRLVMIVIVLGSVHARQRGPCPPGAGPMVHRSDLLGI